MKNKKKLILFLISALIILVLIVVFVIKNIDNNSVDKEAVEESYVEKFNLDYKCYGDLCVENIDIELNDELGAYIVKFDLYNLTDELMEAGKFDLIVYQTNTTTQLTLYYEDILPSEYQSLEVFIANFEDDDIVDYEFVDTEDLVTE